MPASAHGLPFWDSAVTEQIHGCFISYRHPASANNREEKMIKHVFQAVRDHLEMYTHEHGVYFDVPRLKPGYQYEERLAQALCRSACMVIVYWPSYLESDYCKKEIRTMLEIEQRRRIVMGNALHGCRLFVPIILRGKFEELPGEITQNTQYLDYSVQSIRPDFNIGDDPTMSAQLYDIAAYVKDLCSKMKTYGTELFGGCDSYAFQAQPGGLAIASAPPQEFPGRGPT